MLAEDWFSIAGFSIAALSSVVALLPPAFGERTLVIHGTGRWGAFPPPEKGEKNICAGFRR